MMMVVSTLPPRPCACPDARLRVQGLGFLGLGIWSLEMQSTDLRLSFTIRLVADLGALCLTHLSV
jgi:hypothetical protein